MIRLERENKGLIGILGQVWYLIVSIPDLCTITYSNLILYSADPNAKGEIKLRYY